MFGLPPPANFRELVADKPSSHVRSATYQFLAIISLDSVNWNLFVPTFSKEQNLSFLRSKFCRWKLTHESSLWS